jgi:Protein of unknown function (DUF2637)
MPEESTMHEVARARPRPGRVLWLLITAVIVLILTLAGFAFAGMFTAVRDEMIPFFGGLAWIVPVGVDVGILALTASGLLLEWLAMPMPALRWVAMTFMGASVWLNVAAAGGSVTGAVGHAALPVLFIACIEAVRHAVRRTAGMANDTVRDGIPLARWILAPAPTFFLFRRMVLQRVNSYPTAVATELQRRRDIAALRARYGKRWRKDAPGDLVWSLTKGIDLGGAAARVRLLVPPDAPAVPARKATGSAGAPSSPDPVTAGGSGGPTAAVPGNPPVPGSGSQPAGSGSRAARTGTGEPPAGRNRLRDTGELLAEAREIDAAWLQVHGRHIGADALHERMGIRKQTACTLLRQIKAGNTPATTDAEENAP